LFSIQSNAPSANHFILHLLHLRPNHTFAVQEIITACGIMGILANNARVTLARLCRASLILPVERGYYALAPKVLEQVVNPAAFGILNFDNTASVAALAMLARNALLENTAQPMQANVLAWRGGYVMVYVTKPLVQKPRLLALGFKQLEPCLFLRPNTLAWTLHDLEAQFKAHEQVRGGRVFVLNALDAKTAKTVQDLYPIKRLEQGYRHCIKALEKGDQFLAELLQQCGDQQPTDKALRDCYALLARCDVLVQEDPCLPAEWLDTSLLVRCLQLRCALYHKAQQLWTQRLLG
jgi:phenylacetic acid degradation operon negative regulatory protein